ncbi:hypothetical protein GG804_13040 [Sphingomonas histidinilytica]|uniref:hypothetical protein n=1 Tax=Rhizorhabdus histidinilytica TaxID=439228 RepID=UPI001ADA4CDD|nr:hypothetical protein [Rhizorhabdus histidinilytica]MBO9377695.1 hypothetical protein [Rhizorhabdus histidinilytica]
MKLIDYLSSEVISLNAFAARIGAKNARTVQRWTKSPGSAGYRMPSTAMMDAIMRETGGKVQPNDFFEMPSSFPPADEMPTDQARAA